jgi:hypothetical protein
MFIGLTTLSQGRIASGRFSGTSWLVVATSPNWGTQISNDDSSSIWQADDVAMSMCKLCHQYPSGKKGEHIYPRWLLKDEEKNGPGAFDWTYNGQPIKNSEGNQVLAKSQRVRVKLKVYKACNDELAMRFEGPSKDILRELFATSGGVCLESQDARLVGEWFAKTMLLLAHPDRYHDNPVITRNSVRLPDDEVQASISTIG